MVLLYLSKCFRLHLVGHRQRVNLSWMEKSKSDSNKFCNFVKKIVLKTLHILSFWISVIAEAILNIIIFSIQNPLLAFFYLCFHTVRQLFIRIGHFHSVTDRINRGKFDLVAVDTGIVCYITL